MSGSYVLIGAWGVNNGAGAGYLYNDSGQLLRSFSDPQGKTGDAFGGEVAVSGSDVLIGAAGVNKSAGAAYLYDVSGQLLHTFRQAGTPVSNFGAAVALSGTNVLVGAYGAAYLFASSGTLLHAFPDPASGDYFGFAAAISGTDVLIGAPGHNDGPSAAYLYNTSGTLLHTFHAPTTVTAAYPTGKPVKIPYFGDTVALSETDVAIGADGDRNIADAAFLYSHSGQLLDTFTDPNFVPRPPTPVRLGKPVVLPFGNSVAISSSYLIAGIGTFSSGFNGAYLYGLPSSVLADGGGGQSTLVGTNFATQLEAQLTDASGDPLIGYPVTFRVKAASGGAAPSFSGAKSVTVATNAQGVAIAPSATANRIAGSFTVTASVRGVSSPAVFSLTNFPGSPDSVKAVSGNSQSAVVGKTFPDALKARVVDQYGNPLSGVTITFSVINNPSNGAGGTFAGGQTSVAETTNSHGIAVGPILTANNDIGSFEVTASVQGVEKAAIFHLSNTADPPPKVVSARRWWPPWVR